MIELAWPLTVLICFVGTLYYALERLKIGNYRIKDAHDKLAKELVTLKLGSEHADDRFEALTAEIKEMKNDLNSIKLAKGFGRGV
jgi:hypothetical protein